MGPHHCQGFRVVSGLFGLEDGGEWPERRRRRNPRRRVPLLPPRLFGRRLSGRSEKAARTKIKLRDFSGFESSRMSRVRARPTCQRHRDDEIFQNWVRLVDSSRDCPRHIKFEQVFYGGIYIFIIIMDVILHCVTDT